MRLFPISMAGRPRAAVLRGAALLAFCVPALLRAQAPFNPPCQATAAGCAGLPRNFAEVAPGLLYRGSLPSAPELAAVKARFGIRSVVNLRWFRSDRALAAPLGLREFRIPNLATHAEDEDVGAFLRVAGAPANQPLFVHCRYGADRTGLMVAAWRLLVQRPAPADAEIERELRAFEFHDYKSVLRWIRKVEAMAPTERERFREALLKKS